MAPPDKEKKKKKKSWKGHPTRSTRVLLMLTGFFDFFSLVIFSVLAIEQYDVEWKEWWSENVLSYAFNKSVFDVILFATLRSFFIILVGLDCFAPCCSRMGCCLTVMDISDMDSENPAAATATASTKVESNLANPPFTTSPAGKKYLPLTVFTSKKKKSKFSPHRQLYTPCSSIFARIFGFILALIILFINLPFLLAKVLFVENSDDDFNVYYLALIIASFVACIIEAPLLLKLWFMKKKIHIHRRYIREIQTNPGAVAAASVKPGHLEAGRYASINSPGKRKDEDGFFSANEEEGLGNAAGAKKGYSSPGKGQGSYGSDQYSATEDESLLNSGYFSARSGPSPTTAIRTYYNFYELTDTSDGSSDEEAESDEQSEGVSDPFGTRGNAKGQSTEKAEAGKTAAARGDGSGGKGQGTGNKKKRMYDPFKKQDGVSPGNFSSDEEESGFQTPPDRTPSGSFVSFVDPSSGRSPSSSSNERERFFSFTSNNNNSPVKSPINTNSNQLIAPSSSNTNGNNVNNNNNNNSNQPAEGADEDNNLDDSSKLSKLLSLLKSAIGVSDMDSMRITMPSWIHEGDSVLERGAVLRFPHHYLEIQDAGTPLLRMVAVTRFILSTFYPQARTPKKPFNPVIGEQFVCEWPEAGIKYFSEQVSHHPPINTFHYEDRDRNLVYSGSAQSIMSFTGSAFKIVLKGHHTIVINRPKHGKKGAEEYTFTMPTLYIRGLLTGSVYGDFNGEMVINCRQTGCVAMINFPEKPFFGGEIRRVEGIIKDEMGNHRYSVAGNWDGRIDITDMVKQETMVFFDVVEDKPLLPWVPPVQEQGEMQSQKVWYACSSAIKQEKWKEADKAKNDIEELQRKYHRDMEKGLVDKYQPVLFDLVDPDTQTYRFVGEQVAQKRTTWFSLYKNKLK